MAMPTDEQKRSARQHVDNFIAQHRLHAFWEKKATDFEAHAKDLMRFLQTLYGDKPTKVAEEMLRIADDIEENEFAGGGPFSHHRIAAEKIRKQAEMSVMFGCPWADLMVLLQKSPVMRSLAQVIWLAKQDGSQKWKVSLDKVLEVVGGAEHKRRGTLSANASRLTKLFMDNGVHIALSVMSTAEPPVLRCEIIKVEQDKIDNAVDDYLDAASRAELERQHKAEVSKTKGVGNKGTKAKVIKGKTPNAGS